MKSKHHLCAEHNYNIDFAEEALIGHYRSGDYITRDVTALERRSKGSLIDAEGRQTHGIGRSSAINKVQYSVTSTTREHRRVYSHIKGRCASLAAEQSHAERYKQH